MRTAWVTGFWAGEHTGSQFSQASCFVRWSQRCFCVTRGEVECLGVSSGAKAHLFAGSTPGLKPRPPKEKSFFAWLPLAIPRVETYALTTAAVPAASLTEHSGFVPRLEEGGCFHGRIRTGRILSYRTYPRRPSGRMGTPGRAVFRDVCRTHAGERAVRLFCG